MNLVWLHEDALRSDHPVFKAAGDDALTCFIWDEHYLQKMDYGFKRLVFIYETLCELPVTIYRGDTVSTVAELAGKHNVSTIYVPDTPNPDLKARVITLGEDIDTVIVPDISFISPDKDPNIGRFFRYWNKTKKLAMQKHGCHD